MPDSWEPGDLAKCVDDRWGLDHPKNPKVGDVRMVSGVRMSEKAYRMPDGTIGSFLCLTFPGGGRWGWDAASFVKVQPTGRDRSVPELVDRHVKA